MRLIHRMVWSVNHQQFVKVTDIIDTDSSSRVAGHVGEGVAAHMLASARRKMETHTYVRA